MNRKILLLLVTLILSSCTQSVQSVDGNRSTITSNPSVTQAVNTPTPIPTVTNTDIPTVTITAFPSTETPSVISTTPIAPPGPILEHFTAGQEIVITRLQMFNPTNGWGLGGLNGATDHLFLTIDGGAAWTDVTPPQPGQPGTLAMAAFFLDTSTAWATYSNLDTLLPQWPVVWHTSNAGQTWQSSQLLAINDLSQSYATDLFFTDPHNGWLLTHVGAGMSHDYIALFHTTDGGLTWSRLIDPTNDGQIQVCQKNGLFFQNARTGWLTADCGGVMAGVFFNRTDDGGITWSLVDLPVPADNPRLFDVNTAAACGGYDLRFFDSQKGLLGVRCTIYTASGSTTFANYLYTTSNGGITWTSTSYPGGTLLFLDSQTGWALSRDIYQTTDGGATWIKIGTVTWDAHFDFISPFTGWGAAFTDTQYALVQTTNGGESWSILTSVIAP
jgi:photosystem II stability/assembly factor-like uncharacterized protein